jgi:hypothetical protein
LPDSRSALITASMQGATAIAMAPLTTNPNVA